MLSATWEVLSALGINVKALQYVPQIPSLI